LLNGDEVGRWMRMNGLLAPAWQALQARVRLSKATTNLVLVCAENPIQVDDVMESAKLAE
jgi:hypothetical protein